MRDTEKMYELVIILEFILNEACYGKMFANSFFCMVLGVRRYKYIEVT